MAVIRVAADRHWDYVCLGHVLAAGRTRTVLDGGFDVLKGVRGATVPFLPHGPVTVSGCCFVADHHHLGGSSSFSRRPAVLIQSEVSISLTVSQTFPLFLALGLMTLTAVCDGCAHGPLIYTPPYTR